MAEMRSEVINRLTDIMASPALWDYLNHAEHSAARSRRYAAYPPSRERARTRASRPPAAADRD